MVETTLEQIRANDPLRDRADLYLSTNPDFSDAELVEALEQNPHIKSIRFWRARGNWPLLLGHLAIRDNLEEVRLTVGNVPETARSFLASFQQNPNIKNATIVSNVTVSALASFLNASADRITNFSFCSHVLKEEDDLDDGEGPAILAAAFKRCANLERLSFTLLQDEYMAAIFKDAIPSIPNLKTLEVDMDDWSNETHRAFQHVLRTSMTLRRLVILYRGRGTKQCFLQMAKTNFSLCSLTVNAPDVFNDYEQRLLQSYFDRSERVEQFTNNPTIIPKKLLPELLGVVAQANASVLFQSLKTASTDLFASSQRRTRKRKRPAYYKP